MASFYSVLYKRVLLLQRLNPLYSLAFSVKYCIRRPCVASHGAYCTFALSKRNFPSIYLRNNADCAVLFLKAASPIQARFESTTPVTPKENQSRLQQFKKILYNFTQGVKQLYNDVRATFKIRRKLKAYNWNYSALSRKEHWTMFKTQKNLRKTLPIVVLSCLPVIGYSGPIIGFLRPREFLSPPFWTAKQKKRFSALDDKERAEYHGNILKDIKASTENCQDQAEYELLHKLTVQMDQNIEPSNDNLLEFLPIFSTGIFRLENLPHGHLQNLCLFWLLSSWLPSSFIQNKLRKEIISIHRDDAAIVREGIHGLTQPEIDEACHTRGLNTGNASSEELGKWLQDWVELSTRVPESETSFLAHQAVFKTLYNFKQPFRETEISEKNQ